MLFNSFPFLFVFLPIVLVVFYGAWLLGPRIAAIWLAVASIVFYGCWDPSSVVLLLGSVTFNYLFGVLIRRLEEKPVWQKGALAFAIACNVALLAYYKYLFPTLGWLSAHLGLEIVSPGTSILLPLGISFFTFTQIGYLIDLRDGLAKDSGPLDYILFVTFFPHLIAGPILYHRETMPQFGSAAFRINAENLAVGFGIFVIGLAKKVIIADSFSSHVGVGFANPARLDLYAAWTTSMAYSLQIYFDFSGYSDMAVGLARMFGIRFPANFDSPFKSKSIIEFWQRWHMTLSRYLNLYLYSPVSVWVSRRRVAQGKFISQRATATPSGFLGMVALPTFCAMIIAGVWHGAGLQFLAYGLIHGCYLTVNHAWRIFGPKLPAAVPWPARWLVDGSKVLGTYVAVLVSLVFFRAQSVPDAVELLKGMVGMHSVAATPVGALEWSRSAIGILVALGMVVVWAFPNSNEIFAAHSPVLAKIPASRILQWAPSAAWGIALGLVATGSLLMMFGTSEFLYFHF